MPRGRPRSQGEREPNGRLSRRAKRGAFLDPFRATNLWDSFCEAMRPDGGPHPVHPLLILTRHGKFDPKCFMIMVYWAATRSGIAQNWQHRDFLCTITGFDFGTEAGCKAAHAYAIERLGTEIVEALDDAAFTACSIENLRLLEDDLRRLWEAWCSHKSVVCGRVAAKANRRETCRRAARKQAVAVTGTRTRFVVRK